MKINRFFNKLNRIVNSLVYYTSVENEKIKKYEVEYCLKEDLKDDIYISYDHENCKAILYIGIGA